MEDRFKTYSNDVCWQYNIRTNNLESDLIEHNVTNEEVSKLKTSDISLQFEEKKKCYKEVKAFIEKHEWLGRMPFRPTHFFTARYKDILVGVVIMDMPNAFSKMLGEDTRKLERLISRGACISWSPKNLASKLISFSINWMVKNTRYRLFTAYSDTEAKELGTIYQACNFYYIGKNSGSSHQYKLENGRWVSDRYFRSRSVYKRVAKSNDIIWNDDWNDGDKVFFDKMPDCISGRIRELSKAYQSSCEKRKISSKHKYAYVLGGTKSETKKLRKIFEEKNKCYGYPKKRGE